jgi:hypothetical protein
MRCCSIGARWAYAGASRTTGAAGGVLTDAGEERASASPENIAPSEPHLGLAARSSTLESEHGCSTPGVVLGGRSNPPILDAGADKWDSRGWAFGCSPLGGFHVSPFADPGR